jgi:hypothetical protein
MGNAGNTVERWYHRAAVVLWPRERTFVIRAKASAAWAIGEIWKTLQAGAIDEAQGMTGRLLPFWQSVARGERGSYFLQKTLRVAAALDAPELAASLVSPFELERFSPGTARPCVALLEHYGLEWCRTLFARPAPGRAKAGHVAWIASMPAFCKPLCATDSADALELARWIATTQWAWLESECRGCRAYPSPGQAARALLDLNGALLGLLESSVIVEDPDLQVKILGFLTSAENDYPLRCLVVLLRTAGTAHRPSALRALGLGAPRRPQDDWSVVATLGCGCRLCETLAPFLAAHDRTSLEWPLAKEGRRHVHSILEAQDLPVSHETRRVGSPFTLVLRKTAALFQRETAERSAWRVDLAWLRRQRRRFVDWDPHSGTRD